MNDTTLGAVLIGILLPLLVSYLKIKTQNNKVLNYILSLLISLIAGIVVLVFNNQINKASFDLAQIFTTLSVVIAAAQTAYKTFWEPIGVTDKIEKLN